MFFENTVGHRTVGQQFERTVVGLQLFRSDKVGMVLM